MKMPYKDSELRKKKVNEYYQDNKERIKEYQKGYRIKNKEKLSAQKRDYYQQNREKIDKYKKKYNLNHPRERKEYHQSFYQKNKERYAKDARKKYSMEDPIKKKKRRRINHLQVAYGLSLETYNDLYNKQQGCCAICGKHQAELKRTLFVDHDHKINKVRGLLCYACNSGLGFYENHKRDVLNYLGEK